MKIPVLLITGEEDLFCSLETVKDYNKRLKDCTVVGLPQVGHWHIFEDLDSVAVAVKDFL